MNNSIEKVVLRVYTSGEAEDRVNRASATRTV